MLDLTMASLLPILIASVTATCFSYIFVGSESLFSYHMDSAWDIQRVPPYIILGVFCGIVGLYFMRTMTACENMFARRLWRNLCPSIVYRRLLGILLCSNLEYISTWSVCSREEFCTHGYGWCYGRSNASASYWHIPHCRTNSGLSAVYPFNDCLYLCISDHKYL